MSSEVEIAVGEAGGLVVAHVAGEIDVTNVRRLGADLLEVVANEAEGLIVDLAGVRYLDSAGIEMLFETSRRLRRRRQSMALVLPASSPLAPVLEITGVAAAAAVHISVEAALRAR